MLRMEQQPSQDEIRLPGEARHDREESILGRAGGELRRPRHQTPQQGGPGPGLPRRQV